MAVMRTEDRKRAEQAAKKQPLPPSSPSLSICLLAGGPSTEGTSTGNNPQPLLANFYVQQEEQL